MGYYLQMDGTDDYVKTNSSITFDEIILDMYLDVTPAAWSNYLESPGGTDSYFERNGSNADQITGRFTTVYLNGVQKTNSTNFMPITTRCTVRITGTSASSIAYFFANQVGQGPIKGRLYDIKLNSGGITVAHYDFTNQSNISGQTVLDSSGNGNTATLNGGTPVWGTDTAGNAYTVSLSDSINSTETFIKSLSHTLSDAISLSELFNKLYSMTINDSLSFSDSPILRSVGLNKSDIITSSDSISKSLTVTITDVISTTENENKTYTTFLTDSILNTDSIAMNKGKAINLSDAITIVDTISKALSIIQKDTVSTDDSENDAITRQLLDAITQTDTIIKSQNKTIVLSDNLSSTDSITKALDRIQIDTLSLTDTISRRMNVNLYDVIVTNDSISKHLPNAPTLIGTITLEGQRTLYVYLVGSRNLNVNLEGGL